MRTLDDLKKIYGKLTEAERAAVRKFEEVREELIKFRDEIDYDLHHNGIIELHKAKFEGKNKERRPFK